MVTFKRASKYDYMGFAWFGLYEDGKAVLEQGVHIQYHALDISHAMQMHNQISKKIQIN